MFKSVKSCIVAKNYEELSNFYKDLGFSECIISKNISFLKIDKILGFYLQQAYFKDWRKDFFLNDISEIL